MGVATAGVSALLTIILVIFLALMALALVVGALILIVGGIILGVSRRKKAKKAAEGAQVVSEKAASDTENTDQ